MAISFSGNAKSEICRVFPNKKCCALAQCFGILLFCNSFSSDGIRIITESRDFGQNLPKLFRKHPNSSSIVITNNLDTFRYPHPGSDGMRMENRNYKMTSWPVLADS